MDMAQLLHLMLLTKKGIRSMGTKLIKEKIETTIASHPELTVFGTNKIMDLISLKGIDNRRIVAKALCKLRDKGLLTSERNGRHNTYRVVNRINCFHDATKTIETILQKKSYSLHRVERCDHPGMVSTYFVEAKDARGIVVTVGYLHGSTKKIGWQTLVNEVSEYMDEI